MVLTAKSVDVKVQSREVLERLYEVFDELGMVHRYSAELGEIDVKIENDWLNFYLDPDVMKDEQEDQRWADDATMVADYYWRQ